MGSLSLNRRGARERSKPILSSPARKELAQQALRRHATKWLAAQGWRVRIMGVPMLVPTGRTDAVTHKIELLFIGDPF